MPEPSSAARFPTTNWSRVVRAATRPIRRASCRAGGALPRLLFPYQGRQGAAGGAPPRGLRADRRLAGCGRHPGGTGRPAVPACAARREARAGRLRCPADDASCRAALIKRYVEDLRLDPNVSVHSLRVTALTTARTRVGHHRPAGLRRACRPADHADLHPQSRPAEPVAGLRPAVLRHNADSGWAAAAAAGDAVIDALGRFAGPDSASRVPTPLFPPGVGQSPLRSLAPESHRSRSGSAYSHRSSGPWRWGGGHPGPEFAAAGVEPRC